MKILFRLVFLSMIVFSFGFGSENNNTNIVQKEFKFYEGNLTISCNTPKNKNICLSEIKYKINIEMLSKKDKEELYNTILKSFDSGAYSENKKDFFYKNFKKNDQYNKKLLSFIITGIFKGENDNNYEKFKEKILKNTYEKEYLEIKKYLENKNNKISVTIFYIINIFVILFIILSTILSIKNDLLDKSKYTIGFIFFIASFLLSIYSFKEYSYSMFSNDIYFYDKIYTINTEKEILFKETICISFLLFIFGLINMFSLRNQKLYAIEKIKHEEKKEKYIKIFSIILIFNAFFIYDLYNIYGKTIFLIISIILGYIYFEYKEKKESLLFKKNLKLFLEKLNEYKKIKIDEEIYNIDEIIFDIEGNNFFIENKKTGNVIYNTTIEEFLKEKKNLIKKSEA